MGGSAKTFAMAAVAVVSAVAAPYLAPFIAEGLGTVIVGEGAAAGMEGITAAELATATSAEVSGVAASTGVQIASGALAGAAVGGASGAADAAIQGTDPWTGAFQGVEAGAVGGAVSGGVGAVLPSGTNPALAAGLKSASSGFTSSELKGKDLQTSLTAGAISGLTAAAKAELFPQGFLGSGSTTTEYQVDENGNPILDDAGKPIPTQASADAKTQSELAAFAEKGIGSLGGAYIGQNISNLFAPSSPATAASSPSQGYSTPAPTYSASGTQLPSYISSTAPSGYGGVSATGQSTTQGQPGSQALAQALRVGDPSNAGTSVDSPSGGTGADQNVWNTASLRFKDETGSQV